MTGEDLRGAHGQELSPGPKKKLSGAHFVALLMIRFRRWRRLRRLRPQVLKGERPNNAMKATDEERERYLQERIPDQRKALCWKCAGLPSLFLAGC